ncbi:hypothetical protein FJ970_25020 [Mesorhizobium sp. B2-1-8]|uniref:hypothetical protein n=1 Tax=unclassified Mesorhizobium TaxID=325217 RepID=UPI001127AA48|nr:MULTISPECIES: hypothetical protein [unclassified Mesorhizobium]MBZ9706849.1 hypothetical protein [Mesorhizobium sp. ESP7-2]UCI18323.1 hypothetical protein FJ970_25020 [Mesorhizobium sp. B2-1-8]
MEQTVRLQVSKLASPQAQDARGRLSQDLAGMIMKTHQLPHVTASGPLVIITAAVLASAIAFYYFAAPLTGVTGSAGAMLVLIASLALALDGLVLRFRNSGPVFILAWILGLLGALGTFTAAVFLHAWWLVAVVAVVLAGLLITLGFRQTKT